MHRLIAGLALALTATIACADDRAAQPAGDAYTFDTRVIQLPEGARPHDAAPGRPGEIWYTAQRQGALGIIDIASWTYRQVPLGPESAPHDVVLGPDGMAWITDGGQNAIVRYNPASEAIDVWKLPEDTAYTNLNTGAFDGEGVHWFTGQNGIYGKVDGTGTMEVFKDPEGRGRYGIDDTPEATLPG